MHSLTLTDCLITDYVPADYTGILKIKKNCNNNRVFDTSRVDWAWKIVNVIPSGLTKYSY